MKEKFFTKIINLIKVKSIITIISFFTFVYLSIAGKIDTDNFMLILGMIATYFFNKDNIDQNDGDQDEKSN